jgi:hypothetical protein
MGDVKPQYPTLPKHQTPRFYGCLGASFAPRSTSSSGTARGGPVAFFSRADFVPVGHNREMSGGRPCRGERRGRLDNGRRRHEPPRTARTNLVKCLISVNAVAAPSAIASTGLKDTPHATTGSEARVVDDQ